MKKDTPSSSKLFERWLSDSLAEWISMNTAFTNFLEIVIISVLNINPAIQWTERRKEREERYKHLINTRRDKNIPMTMLSDLITLMQEHHEEKKDIIWEMYESFICQWEHGQFFTPPHIADMMAQVVEVDKAPSWDTVIDMTCWSGKLLMWALKNNPRVNLIWMDLDRRCAMMACINCLFYGGCGTFLVWNSLANEFEDGWRVSYGMLYEIPKEQLKEIKLEKEGEKPEPIIEEVKSYEVQWAIQQSLF